MANIVNQYGQVKLGVRYTSAPLVSTLWGNVFGVWNGEALGTSLDTSIFRAYNGEAATVTPTQLSTNIFGVWNGETLGTSLDTSIHRVYNGDNVNDTSGNAQNGTNVGGVTFTTGKVGNAFTFNGSNYVKLPNSSLNSLTGDFTVSFWFYGNGSGVSQSLFSNVGYNGTIAKGLFIYQTTTYEIGTNIDGGGGRTSLQTTSITNGVWHHIVVTRLGSTRTRIYIDGALAASNSDTRNPEYFTNNTPCIGALDYNPNFALTTYYASNGTKIDAFNVWNRELTAGEVTNLYNGNTGAEYPFSSQTLATYNDSVGSNHGTTPASTLTGGVPGPSFTTGKIGKAFTFDGINDFVELGDIMDLGLSSWSYSMWFNVSNTNNSMLFSKTIQASSFGRIWAGTNASKVYFAFQVDLPGSNPSSNIVIETTSNISTNTWYHVTFVFDRSDKMKIYLNGSLSSVNTTSGTNNLIPYSSWNINTNHPFRIGAFTTSDNIGTTANFTGKIDAFSVWNRALTNDEVTALYNSGNGQQYPFSSVTLSNSMLDSVNAINGTNVNNVTLTTGKVGNAFTFNGSNYIQLPNSSNQFNFTTDFSFSFWVYIPSISTATNGIFANYTNVGGSKGFIAYLKDDGKFEFLVLGTNGTSTATSTAQIPTGWTHIAVARKMITSKETYIYINGLLNTQSGINNAVTLDFYSTTNPSIGAINSLNTGPVQNLFGQMMNNSKIDGLTIWNKVLTASEITQLYNGGSGAEYPFSTQLLPSYNDAVGSNHGTTPASTLTGGVPGPSFTTGKIGQAFNFDGINDIVRLSNNSLDLTGDFSISMWVNWGRNNTSQILMSNFTIGASTRGWFIEHASGQLRFRGFNSTGGNAFYIYTAYTPPLNTWVHYTFVHKNNSNKMYADGVLIGSDTGGSTHVAYDTPNYPMIGANQYNATTYQEFFQGKLDAVSVWNRELTATEVTELYNSGNGKQYPTT